MKRKIVIQIVFLLLFSLKTNAQTKGNDSIGFQGAHITDSLNKMKKFNLEVGITLLNVVSVGGNAKFDYLINKRKGATIGISATFSDNKSLLWNSFFKNDKFNSQSLSGHFVNISAYYGGRYSDKKHPKTAGSLFLGVGYTSLHENDLVSDINEKWSFNRSVSLNTVSLFWSAASHYKAGPGWVYFETSYYIHYPLNNNNYLKTKIYNQSGEPIDTAKYIASFDDTYVLYSLSFNIGYKWSF